MYILGLGGMLEFEGHDHAACLLRDDKIVAAAEEERFTRIKHSPGQFPVNAAAFCLSQAGVTMKEVDIVAYSYLPEFSNWGAAQLLKPRSLPGIFRALRLFKTQPLDFMNVRFGSDFDPGRFRFVGHHLCHASMAYYLSGFNKSMILSIDGSGEATSTYLGYGKNGEIHQLSEVRLPNSLGLMYSAFTQYLGFRPDNGEPKVMGLAAYGNPSSYDMGSLLRKKKLGFEMETSMLQSWAKRFSDLLEQKFGPRRRPWEPIEKRHKDIAASLQFTLEKMVQEMVRDIYEVTGYRKIVLSGGVALNCKMNGTLLDLDFVDEIYVPPATNDAGTALGAAISVANEAGYSFDKLCSTSLGRGYDDKQIEEAIQLAKVKSFEKTESPAEVAAEKILAGKIVGWFQGRFEFGPRALGNRSILVDPRDGGMKDVVNKYVKHREPFRPFAPSILEDYSMESFENAQPSPFMTIAFRTKPDRISSLAASVHVDGTSRPHTVNKSVDPLYHKLIHSFSEETGVGAVLNTSFNVAGEPIVGSPVDAIRTFFGTGLDCLIMGSYLLEK